MKYRLMSIVLSAIVVAAMPAPAARAKPPADDLPRAVRVGSTQPGAGISKLAVTGVFIKNWRTARCIDLPGSGPGVPFGPVNQYQCAPNDNQNFNFVHMGDNIWQIKNTKDNLCLDAYGLVEVPTNAVVFEDTCSGGSEDNDYWRPEFSFAHYLDNNSISASPCPIPRGRPCTDWYKLRNMFRYQGYFYFYGPQCLDVPGPGTGGDNVRLAVYPCSANDDHEWTWF
jgi:hypothetical protein